MQSMLLAVDRLSTWMGQAFAWSIVLLTFGISWEVFSRYALGEPHDWNLNVQIMLYGTLFMMAGAYTLSKNNHVRGDVLYGFFRPRTQATVDLVLYIVFFLPGIVALTWAGWTYFNESLAMREQAFEHRLGFVMRRHHARLCRCGGRQRDGRNGECGKPLHGVINPATACGSTNRRSRHPGHRAGSSRNAHCRRDRAA